MEWGALNPKPWCAAPPLKLKQSGWIGNYALGSSYIGLPWWAGQALFGTLTPDVSHVPLLQHPPILALCLPPSSRACLPPE